MKNIKNIFYCLVFLSLVCFAQEEDTLSYFPLQVGNLWQYYQTTGFESDYFQMEVLSADSCAEDSSITYLVKLRYAKIPFKVYMNDPKTIYWKASSDSVWTIRYKFDAEVEDYWLSYSSNQYYTVYKGCDEDILFNQNVDTKEFWLTSHPQTTLPLETEFLAKGFGWYYGEFEVGATYLIGGIINGVKYGTIVGVEENNNEELINTYQLANYPNPFNGQTRINFSIPQNSLVTIRVYNLLGQIVEEIYRGRKEAGKHIINWQPTELSSGAYIVVLQTPNQIITTKVLYLK